MRAPPALIVEAGGGPSFGPAPAGVRIWGGRPQEEIMSTDTTTAVNHQFRLKSRPVGDPKRSDFDFVEEPVGEPQEGQFLVRVQYISLDPAMRGWMNDVRSYLPPVGLGEVMRAGAVGQVVASRNPKFAEGDHVYGTFGVQDFAISDGKGVVKVDPAMAPLPVFLSMLGMPGLTAYFGLFEVGAYKEGDTVVVSGAAGAVGSVVGQLAKIKGSRAIGIAGGKEKCDYVVNELGFDACIDYKSEDVAAGLREHCPDRIDIYFDNVGGEILDAALARLAFGGRVVLCGAISQYNNTGPMRGPSNYMSLLVNRGRMQGFLVFDYADRYLEAATAMAGWRAEGKLTCREDIVEGLETFPDTLMKLFRGENMGKLVLKVAD
jgi:NADPH-dependent curcumin reductase CurA